MKRILVWFFVTLIGCCALVDARHAGERNDTVARLKDATVALVNRGTPTGEYDVYCSGVWVGKNLVLTAKHCITASDPAFELLKENDVEIDLNNVNIEYVSRGDLFDRAVGELKARAARTVAVDDYQDLALIQTDADETPDDHPVIDIGIAPTDGEDLHIVGHTMGMWWTYLRGYVSATRGATFDWDGNRTKAIQIASPVWKGNSGGGAFNANGELVGVSSWVSAVSPNMSFFIHRDEVVAFLRRHHY